MLKNNDISHIMKNVMLPISARVPAELKAHLIRNAKENGITLGEQIALVLSLNGSIDLPSAPDRKEIRKEVESEYKQKIDKLTADLKKAKSDLRKLAKSQDEVPAESKKVADLVAELEEKIFSVKTGPSWSHSRMKAAFLPIKKKYV